MDETSRKVTRATRAWLRALAIGAISITSSCGGGGNDENSGGPPVPPLAPVTLAAPAISYAQTSYALMTGVPLADVMPVNTGGAATAWSVTPALPAGLTFSASDGSIRGRPEAVSGPTTHVVRADNAAGMATATLAVSVESGVLLDLGHTVGIELLRYTGSRILSVQAESFDDRHWVLWDAQTGQSLAQGDTLCPACQPAADLAGPVFVVKMPTRFEVHSSADGRVLSTIDTILNPANPGSNTGWWKLAADGSYLAAQDQGGLTIWSTDGAVLASRPGNYSGAAVFAAAGELRIARGPAGADRIETIAIPTGTVSVGPAFAGGFHSWFADGERFLTNVSNTVWVYSKDAVQEDLRALPGVVDASMSASCTGAGISSCLGGSGQWFWARAPRISQGSAYDLSIYAVGASASPTETYPDTAVSLSGGTLLIEGPALLDVGIVDLSGSSPTLANHSVPRDCGAYAAISSSQWICASGGIVFDSTGGTPRYFGLGTAFDLAGGSERVAVATELGPIIYFNARTKTEEGRIDFPASKLAMSDDGSILVAIAQGASEGAQDTSIRTFALPSGALLATYPYSGAVRPAAVSLSGSGTRVGKVLRDMTGFSPVPLFRREVTPIGGSPMLWSDSVQGSRVCISCGGDVPVLLSPDGTAIAVSNNVRVSNVGTNIYENGVLVGAAPGWAVGWIDDDRLLLNVYNNDLPFTYRNASIVSATGHALPAPTLREVRSLQRLSADTIYAQDTNLILSLTTGATIWSSPNLAKGRGAVAGGRVIFVSGPHLRAEPY